MTGVGLDACHVCGTSDDDADLCAAHAADEAGTVAADWARDDEAIPW